jgi:transcriptional regulator with XRE-family HTH domain/tetratricopeptide (TPR) repeat protein
MARGRGRAAGGRGISIPNERLAEQRRLRGWSQNQVADRMHLLEAQLGLDESGVDGNQVSRWERRKVVPDPRSTTLLCALYGLPPSDLGLADYSVSGSSGAQRPPGTSQLDVDARSVGRWELGKTQPNPTYTALLSLLYSLPSEHLDIPPLVLPVASPPATATTGRAIEAATVLDSHDEDVNRREFTLLTVLGLAGLPGVALAQRLALEVARHGFANQAATIDEWHLVVSQYGRDYMVSSPAKLLDSLLVDVAALQMALTSAGAPHRHDLQSIGAMLAHFTALTLGNLGRLQESRRWWQTANRLASESGDPYTIAWVKGCELGRAFYESQPISRLIELTEEADTLACTAPDAALTELLVGKTQVLTILERTADVEATLELFREAIAKLSVEHARNNNSWLGWAENRLRFAESFAYSHQGKVPQADEAQRRAITLYPAWYQRGPVKIELQRAFALVRSGDITTGIRHAQAVLSNLKQEQRDWPIVGFGHEILQGVPSESGAHESIVAEFRNQLALPEGDTT